MKMNFCPVHIYLFNETVQIFLKKKKKEKGKSERKIFHKPLIKNDNYNGRKDFKNQQ